MNIMDVAQKAREAAESLTGSPADGVASCERRENAWIATVDVLESKARLDDNDLLSTYEIQFDGTGEIAGFTRRRRYFRNTLGEAVEA